MQKGFTANIYRDNYKCPINVMMDVKEVTIIDAKVPAMWEPTEKAPAVILVTRNICGKIYTHAQPQERGSYAFGGSFIYCSDSRFPATYPIPLHDRDMSKER